MAKSSANIDSPEVIRQFRVRFVEFDGRCRQALDGVRADVRGTLDWLRRDRLAHWKRQLRKREELVVRAKGEYVRAKGASKYTRKDSCYDERKALEKAERLRAEAEEKIAAIKKWLLTLEQETSRLLQPCMRLASLLDGLTPKALARLDVMLDSLDEYLRLQTPQSGDKPDGRKQR